MVQKVQSIQLYFLGTLAQTQCTVHIYIIWYISALWYPQKIMDHCITIFWWMLAAGLSAMSQSFNCLKHLKSSWTWQWVNSNGLSHQISINRAPLGCDGIEDLSTGCWFIQVKCLRTNSHLQTWPCQGVPAQNKHYTTNISTTHCNKQNTQVKGQYTQCACKWEYVCEVKVGACVYVGRIRKRQKWSVWF